MLVKYWFSVSREEQRRRFLSRLNNPAKRWKLSKIEVDSCSYWQGYSEAAQRMFSCCNHSLAPWYVVASDNKHLAHLNYLRHFLSLFCYENPELEELDLSSCSMTTTPEHDEIGADLIEAYYDSEDL